MFTEICTISKEFLKKEEIAECNGKRGSQRKLQLEELITLNYGDIGREFGISEVTAKKWISLLVTSGLVYLLKPYSSNVEKRVVPPPKIYFLDTGLAAFLTKWTNPEILQNGAMAGAFFETYVISEIIKSFANKGIEPPIYFYRDKDKIEIDLIIEQNNTIFAIEIKKTATPKSDDAKKFLHHRPNKKCANRTACNNLHNRQNRFDFKQKCKCFSCFY